MVDVDHFLSRMRVREGDRPVGADCLVEVDRALVVALLQATWTGQGIHPALADAVDDVLDDDPHVVAMRLSEEVQAARRIIGQRVA